jgi:hypothetical protein
MHDFEEDGDGEMQRQKRRQRQNRRRWKWGRRDATTVMATPKCNDKKDSDGDSEIMQ